MTSPRAAVLEFPAMLHGPLDAIRHAVESEGQRWAREYLETATFTPPRSMRQVSPGEPLVMHSAAEFEFMSRPSWRPHLFLGVFMNVNEGIPEVRRPHARQSFENFCLDTPWGALYHAVSPPPPRSAQRMARRLTALLDFWELLQGPRYAYRVAGSHHTLEALMDYIYRETMEAWCPGGPRSVREHLTLTVERMASATREDCLEAVLRVIPLVLRANTALKHRDILGDPRFLRERLTALSLEDFEAFSSAYRYAVNGPLSAWDRALDRH